MFAKIRRAIRRIPRRKWPLAMRIAYEQQMYKKAFGHGFDLRNPKLFTEKTEWYKFYYKNPIMKRIVDKYEFKHYVEEKLGAGYTIPVYGCWNSVEEIKRDWDSLPNTFILKSTVSYGGKNIKVVKDKASMPFSQIEKEIKPFFNSNNTMIESNTCVYYLTKPRVLAEQYIAEVGDLLDDYKFFCFSGQPYCAYVATNRVPGEMTKISFYDLEWNMLDVHYGKHENNHVEKPAHFEEMLEISRKLSKGFPFVRVDFFNTKEKLYVAEMTFFSGGGSTPYHPESFNRELGDLFILPKQKQKHWPAEASAEK